VQHEIVVDNKRLARLVRRCQELPGQQLFQYIDDNGQRRPVDSGEVNDYLREAMGGEFTAKDFRTWGATMLTIDLLSGTSLPDHPSERACQGKIARVVRRVAADAAQHTGRSAESRISTPQYSRRGAVDDCIAA
jgi:DNA topoisomerase IB